MGQRSIRFPDELETRIEALARADDRSFSYVVLRTLESTLENEPQRTQSAEAEVERLERALGAARRWLPHQGAQEVDAVLTLEAALSSQERVAPASDDSHRGPRASQDSTSPRASGKKRVPSVAETWRR